MPIATRHKSNRKCESSEDSEEKCCRKLGKFIQKKFPCTPPRPIRQCDIPITIDEEGVRCIVEDLIYTGNQSAITITANNVILNFDKHRLTLTDVTAKGIDAENVDNLVINEVDIRLPEGVRSFDLNSSAIYLNGCEHVLVNDTYLYQTGFGINVNGSSDVKLVNVFATNNGQSNIFASDTDGLVLDASFLTNTADDLLIAGMAFLMVRDLTIKDSQFINSDYFLASVSGGLIKNNEQVIDDPNYGFGLIQLGASGIGSLASDVKIIDNVFLRRNDITGTATGFLLIFASGILAENNIFEMQFVGDPSLNLDLLIVIEGGGGFNTQDLTVRNCSIRGSSLDSVAIVSDLVTIHDGFLFENNQISGGVGDGVYINSATNIVFKDNQVKGSGGNGFNLDILTTNTALLSNVVTGNIGNGVLIASGVNNNLVQDNKVFGNGGGIVDNGSNVVDDNTTFNNVPPIATSVVKKDVPAVRKVRKARTFKQ